LTIPIAGIAAVLLVCMHPIIMLTAFIIHIGKTLISGNRVN
jgi:hypothetical protein